MYKLKTIYLNNGKSRLMKTLHGQVRVINQVQVVEQNASKWKLIGTC